MREADKLDVLGRKLAAARAFARLTVIDMAEAIGCSRNTIYDWEAGRLPKEAWKREDIVRRYREVTGVDPVAFGLEEKAAA